MVELKWNKSEDGFCETKCGLYEIEPNFCGRTRPVSYTIYRRHDAVNREKINKSAFTMRDAKQVAADDFERTTKVDAALAAYSDFMDQVI